MKDVVVIKKDGTTQDFNPEKIKKAITKSADRVLIDLSEEQKDEIVNIVEKHIDEKNLSEISIYTMHNLVEGALDEVSPEVAKSYRDYRDYKTTFVDMLDKVYRKSQSIMYIGDKENANSDSALVSTKRSLIFNQLNKELYQKFFLNREEQQAINDGYIYIHDMSARRDTMNCCLFRMGEVLKGGFEMGNVWYNEPKTLDTACDVISDVILNAASQQYGGFTVPEIDKILRPYAEKSLKLHKEEYFSVFKDSEQPVTNEILKKAEKYAWNKTVREMEQGYQGWEYKLNTVASSRGDYPFTAISFGLGTDPIEKMISKAILRVHREGQGKKGNKIPVLFPKLIFLYTKDLHGIGAENEDVFEEAVKTSAKTMYPDYTSLDSDDTIGEMWHKYHKAISPMGCRAYLSPWYERGGAHPADDKDVPVFEGRFNIGAVSLHLPMILAKARKESRDFYEVLDYYMELIRKLHIRTYAYLGEMRASTNPLAYCEGGFYGGNLKPYDKIKPLLKSATASFGITALNELQELYNGKSLVEDGEFVLEVMRHIQDKVNEYKAADGNLYAIYGTPAENLCFSGDTLIQTYNGETKISDIKPGDLVYSFNKKLHKIELKPVIEAKKTQDHAVVTKITLDNGQTLTCTPNHTFCIRVAKQDKVTGRIIGEELEWIEARELQPGMRIKSNYIKVNPLGRPECSNYYNGKKQLIQTVNAEYAYGNIEKGYVVHHKDENKLNNSFENLEVMTDADHRRIHVTNISDFKYTSEKQTDENNSFFGKHHTEAAKKANREAHIGKSIERFSINGLHLEHYECIDDAEAAGYTRHLVKLACYRQRSSKIYPPNYYKNSLWYFTEDCEYLLEANHKVASVEYLQELMPVYNIEVMDNHNYFVGGNDGMLVHNCGLQIKQFRAKYGIVDGVSDRPYVSNSFHCHVSEDITPIQKQDLEKRFWSYFQGGRIQYVKYPVNYNVTAIKSLIRRAMSLGFYEGVNMALSYCNDCGHEELDMDVCPVCGSRNLTKIDRMNGYLAYSRVHGDTRLNEAKMAEIADRKSM